MENNHLKDIKDVLFVWFLVLVLPVIISTAFKVGAAYYERTKHVPKIQIDQSIMQPSKQLDSVNTFCGIKKLKSNRLPHIEVI